MAEPRITSIEVHEYAYTLSELGTDYNGFNLGSVREPDIGGRRLAAGAYQHAERRYADAPTRID
jgi:hypothetical protein